MENTKPKEILENIINVMEKTNVDEWEIDKLVVVLNYINELEKRIDKTIEYIKEQGHYLIIEDEGNCCCDLEGTQCDYILDILRGNNEN